MLSTSLGQGGSSPVGGTRTASRTGLFTREVASLLQFIADGVFYAELNELLTRELAADGYSGVEVRVTPLRTEIIIRATRTQSVLGEWFHLVGWQGYDSSGLAFPQHGMARSLGVC